MKQLFEGPGGQTKAVGETGRDLTLERQELHWVKKKKKSLFKWTFPLKVHSPVWAVTEHLEFKQKDVVLLV